MKKDKKNDKDMMALYRQVDEVLKRGEELSRKLSLKIVEDACSNCKNSDMVVLIALARTVFDVVDAQMEAGYTGAFDRFNALLELEFQAKLMTVRMKSKDKDIRTTN